MTSRRTASSTRMRTLIGMAVAAVLLTALLPACTPDSSAVSDAYYMTTEGVPTSGWSAFDTLTFDLPRTDSTRQLNLMVGVRATHHYPFRNLQLRATLEQLGPRIRHIKVQGGDTVSCDTVQSVTLLRSDRIDFRLYDADDQPVNAAILYNDVCRPLYPLTLDKGQRYRLRVTHTMRGQTVRGLSQIYVLLTL